MRIKILVSAILLIAFGCKEYPNPVYTPLDFKAHESNGLYVPDDWEAEVWAESPQLYNPTNIDVDAKGRVWAVEAVNYRDFNNKGEAYFFRPKGDRVVILEDTDNDGKADKSTVFVQDTLLTAPMGIGVIGNKVYVSAAPNLIVYTDENGDDKPDKREIFLTGFGGFDHDHSLHAVLAGPDGNLYFNTGNAGPHMVTDASGWNLRSGSIYNGGTPYNHSNKGNKVSDDGRVWTGGLALRINPDGKNLKVMGHNFRNAYELTVDSYGNIWQNDNDDGVLTCRFTWLMEGGNVGFFNEDGTRTWQNDRRPHQSNFTAHWHQEDPGVIPAGDNTGPGAPTGVAFYEGDAFGENYRGIALSADAGRNTIFGYKPNPEGAGFELNRTNIISSVAEQDEEYLWHINPENKNKWFRPSDVAVGADGAIYVADWYDPIVGGHQMKETKGYGRIYRITPKGKKLVAPKINYSTVVGCVDALKNPAVNVRFDAFTKLISFGDESISPVADLLYDSNPYVQARAVWVLSNLGSKGLGKIEEIKAHPNAQVRIAAVRALAQQLDESSFLKAFEGWKSDPSLSVKRVLLTSMKDVKSPEKVSSIIDLAQYYDGEDRWYLESLGMAAEGFEDDVWKGIESTYKPVISWDRRFEGLAWRFHPDHLVKDFEQRANDESLDIDERKRSLVALAFINTTDAVDAMERLTKSSLLDVARHADYWMGFRKTNTWFNLRDWADADQNNSNVLEILRNGNKKYDVDAIAKLSGQVNQGKALFDTYCATCHRVGNEGRDIGPNLSWIKNKYDKVDLLASIINPDLGIQFGYEPWEITTNQDNKIFGFLLSDGETVVIKDISGKKFTFNKEDIKSKVQLEKSVMPDAGSLGLDEAQLADITAFLMK
jgi:putative membrane-bound dehydrogenase-like protein